MKRWVYAVSVYSVLAFLILGCTEGKQLGVRTHIDPDAGINVGNGNKPVDEKEYRSGFNFMIRYHKDLTLSESANKKQVTIDNRSLIESNASSSVIKFDVLEPEKDYAKFSASSDLKTHIVPMTSWAEKENPGKKFSPVSFPGASGIYFEERETGKLVSRYYVLTTNFLLIKVEIDAYVAGNGLAWVAPIVHTFTADMQPPVLKGLRIEPLEAGKKGEVWFQATDDYSGISKFFGNCWLLRPVKEEDHVSIPICNYAKPRGDDWYSMEFDIDQYKPSGEYYLDSLYMRDEAGNIKYYYPDLQSGKYRGTEISILKVNVVNTNNPDTTAPVLKALKMEPLVAGKKGEVWFQATDDNSGISKFFGNCWLLRPVKEEDHVSIPICNYAKPRGDDWYSMEVEVDEYKPSGEYYLDSLYMRDEAGNIKYYYPDLQSGKYRGTDIPVLKVLLIK